MRQEALRRRKSVVAAVAMAAALAAACAAPPEPEPPAAAPRLADFQVSSRGHEAGGDFCSDFTLSPPQARAFFDRARAVSAAQMHEAGDRLACWVRGTARDAGGVWQWEVRAGGTARLVAPDGQARLFLCTDCADMLR